MKPLVVVGLVLATQFADLVTSLHGFAIGKVELNPLIHTLGDLIAVKALSVILTLSVLIMARSYGRRPVWMVVAGAAVFASGAALNASLRNLGL